VTVVDGINTVNFDPPLDVISGDSIGFAWSFYGSVSYNYSDIVEDNLCYCYGENKAATSGVAAESATVNLKVVPDPNEQNPSEYDVLFRNSYREYAFQAEYCSADCEMIGTGDLVEYQKTDTEIRGIMVDIGSPFPSKSKVKKIQFYAGGVDGDERCGTAGPKCWVGRQIFVGIFRPEDNSTCGKFYIPRLKKVTVVDGLNTYDYPAPDYIDVEAGDCVGWAWLDYGAISFDFADINEADRSENLAYCYGENTGRTSGRARFEDYVTLDVVPDPAAPLDTDSYDYRFRPSYRKYALQAEFCPGSTCLKKADVVFLLDSSGSIDPGYNSYCYYPYYYYNYYYHCYYNYYYHYYYNYYPYYHYCHHHYYGCGEPPHNWLKMLTFVTDTIDRLNIGAEDVQVGVVRFESSATNQIFLNEYYDKVELKNQVSSIEYTSGGTNTHLGIDLMRLEQFDVSHGHRIGVPKIAVIITDGQANDHSAAIASAEDAKAADIQIFCIGVDVDEDDDDDDYAIDELAAMSSYPHQKDVNYWTTMDFDTLQDLVGSISSLFCA
jgi:hypothetical protein